MHDYTEADRWDWDYGDPRQRCRHGNFIGSAWGPDILCGDCESMQDDPSLNDMLREIDRNISKIQHEFNGMSNFISTYISSNGSNVKDPAFSEAVLETMKRFDERRNLLQEDRKRLIEKYEPFCEDGDWDDTSILWKYHREMIRQFDKAMQEEETITEKVGN